MSMVFFFQSAHCRHVEWYLNSLLINEKSCVLEIFKVFFTSCPVPNEKGTLCVCELLVHIFCTLKWL